MKRFFLYNVFVLLFLQVCVFANVGGGNSSGDVQNAIYISPNGDDNSGKGTFEQPYFSLSKAIEAVKPGGYIIAMPGVYHYSSTVIIQKDGSSSAPITLMAYDSLDKPVFDFFAQSEDPSNRGIVLDADYWIVHSIIIQNAGDNGMLLSGNHNILKYCEFRKNRDSGLQLSRYNTNYDNISQWPSYNYIYKCISYDNCDSDHEDADGFAPKLTCGEGNIFKECIAHHNIDDGWDLYCKSETGKIGVVVLDGCISHDNGVLSDGSTSGNGDKNGFKLGSSAETVNHIVKRCIAYNNGHHGFTDNGNIGSIQFINNTSYNNAEYNFHTRDGATHIFINNLSFQGGHDGDRIVGDASAPNAFIGKNWPFTATANDFQSLTPGPDNNPLINGFLHLKVGSPLIDAGQKVDGIQYYGSAPDLGAIEYGMVTSVKDDFKEFDKEGYYLIIAPNPLLGNVATAFYVTKKGYGEIEIYNSQMILVAKLRVNNLSGKTKFIIKEKGLYKAFLKVDNSIVSKKFFYKN